MNQADFDEVFDAQVKRCRDILVVKAAEYSPVDRLQNFKTAAALEGVDMKVALAGMMAKHTVSVYDMIGSGKVFPKEVWDEKITDHMNYLILLRAMVEEQDSTKMFTENIMSVGEARLRVGRRANPANDPKNIK